MRRLTLFDELKLSPDSGPSRTLITASSTYGITEGGYQAEEIKLTELGNQIFSKDDATSKIDAIFRIEIFHNFFEEYKSAVLPSDKAAHDFLIKQGLSEENVNKCYEIIKKNGEDLYLIQELSGAKRVVTKEAAVEKLSSISGKNTRKKESSQTESRDRDNEEETNIFLKDEEGKSLPSIHIDIQIHISPDTPIEKIDEIFSSMEKHLYHNK